MEGTPTIKDVAKLAGVSNSTVSRVMNDSKPVSPESRRKVLDAIHKLDFKPNELARSLVMKRSNVIGVVVKDIGIPYMADIIRGIEEIGGMYDFDILLASTYGEEESELDTIRFVFTKRVDGIILISEKTTQKVVDSIKEHRLPFLILDRMYDESRIDTVDIDYESAMNMALEFIIEMGHKKILHVGRREGSRSGVIKYNTYREMMRNNNLEEHFVPITGSMYGDYEIQCDKIYEYMIANDITVVLCADDTLAVAFMNNLYDRGVRVPDEVSVFGFGDDFFSEIYRPKISTIGIPYYDIGAISMRKLIKHLRKKELIEGSSIVPARLIKRGSVAKYKDEEKTKK